MPEPAADLAPRLCLFDPAADTGDDGDMKRRPVRTVAEVVNHWRAVERSKYTPRSFVERDRYMERLLEHCGPKPVAELRPADLIVWIHSREGWKSANTKNAVARAIAHVFRLAARHGLIDTNPAAELQLDFEEGEGRRPVTWDELRTMLRVATDARIKQFLIFLWWGGMRPGEAGRLCWPDVEPSNLFLRLKKHKTRKKTKKDSIRPLMLPARKLLAYLRRRAVDPAGPVFATRLGTPWNAQNLAMRMRGLRERGNIPDDAFFHGIRHSYGTERILEQAPIKLVSSTMGHANTQITEKKYVHLDSEAESIARSLDEAHARKVQGELARRKPKKAKAAAQPLLFPEPEE